MEGLAWAIRAVIACACLVVGWVALDAAVWPWETLAEVAAACRVVPADGEEDPCIAFVRESVGKWHRRERTAGLAPGPPSRLCAGRTAEMDDPELRRVFAAWAEREVRRGGGRTMAHLSVVSFVQDEVGCGEPARRDR